MKDDPPEKAPPGNRPEGENLSAPRFEKGRSGNPGGRPRSLPRFRAKNRKGAQLILDQLLLRMADPAASLGEVVRAYESVCAMGGYLPADKDAGIDLSQGRLVLLAMAVKGLTRAQRAILIEDLERKALTGGDDGDPG
jgi:hypothetical protein